MLLVIIMLKENRITVNNLMYSLLFLVFGIILLTSTENLISLASKVVGVILSIIGIIKIIVYIYMKGKLGKYSINDLIFGLLMLCGGILTFLYSDVLSFTIRIIMGFWILFSGINRIVLAISIKKIDNTGFKVYLITSLLMLLLGIVLLTGLFDRIIGIFIIGYAIIEIINYIYSNSRNKNFNSSNKSMKKSKKQKYKTIKEPKVIDAIIDEE